MQQVARGIRYVIARVQIAKGKVAIAKPLGVRAPEIDERDSWTYELFAQRIQFGAVSNGRHYRLPASLGMRPPPLNSASSASAVFCLEALRCTKTDAEWRRTPRRPWSSSGAPTCFRSPATATRLHPKWEARCGPRDGNRHLVMKALRSNRRVGAWGAQACLGVPAERLRSAICRRWAGRCPDSLPRQ